MKTWYPLLALAALGVIGWYWYKPHKGIYLYPEEQRELNYLVHYAGYTEAEALEAVLQKRLEYRGSSGWAE